MNLIARVVQGGVDHFCVWRRVNLNLILCRFVKLIAGAAVWGGGEQGGCEVSEG